MSFFFFQAEDGIRDLTVTGVQTCALPISSDDPHLETDVQFGVTRALIGQYVLHSGESPPADDVHGAWYTLDHHFVIEPGEARLPKPPITGKAGGERPTLTLLERCPDTH